MFFSVILPKQICKKTKIRFANFEIRANRFSHSLFVMPPKLNTNPSKTIKDDIIPENWTGKDFTSIKNKMLENQSIISLLPDSYSTRLKKSQ